MKFTKKTITNFVFVILLCLIIYPNTRVFFIRVISMPPSIEEKKDRKTVNYTNWALSGLNVASLNGDDLTGKVAFINFWATWCLPCVAEMPGIKKLYDDYKDRIVFLFITNENWLAVSKFYEKKGYDFPTFNANDGVPGALFSRSIPTTYLIDKNQRIIIYKKGTANWNSKKVRETLDELIKKMPEAMD